MTRSLRFYTKAKRAKPQRPEAGLQKAVIEHLRMLGTPGVIYFSIPNERKCSDGARIELCKMGMLPGASDLVIGVPGQMPLFLELKAKGEKPRLNQLLFGDAVVRAGYRYEVADDIKTVLRIIRDYGAIRPDAAMRGRAA